MPPTQVRLWLVTYSSQWFVQFERARMYNPLGIVVWVGGVGGFIFVVGGCWWKSFFFLTSSSWGPTRGETGKKTSLRQSRDHEHACHGLDRTLPWQIAAGRTNHNLEVLLISYWPYSHVNHVNFKMPRFQDVQIRATRAAPLSIQQKILLHWKKMKVSNEVWPCFTEI